jgi:predicted lipoprotein with Yx(FWY)xxD motif
MRRATSFTLTLAASLAALGVVLQAPPASAATGTTVGTRSTGLGLLVVASSAHRTVYLFTRDTRNHSACGRTCRQTWLPVKTSGKPRAAGAVRAGRLGQTGAHQVTYYGHPLYYYAGDHRTAGLTRGQGRSSFGGRWWVVSPAGKAGTGTTVGTATVQQGTVLATRSGRSLYLLTNDTATRSTCGASDYCSTSWPPLLTTGQPHVTGGLSASLLGTLRRSDGTRQVSYNGHPLYTYAGDMAAGQSNGQCLARAPGRWYLVDPGGGANTTGCSSPPAPSPPPANACTPRPNDGVVSTAMVGSTQVLVDSAGCSLYELTADSATASSCTGTCASGWPPLLTSTSPSAMNGAQSSMLGTISRPDTSLRQVTYAGHPLYRYGGDSSAGDDNGEGAYVYGGYWYLLAGSGAAVLSP